MAVRLTDKLMDLADIVRVIDAYEQDRRGRQR